MKVTITADWHINSKKCAYDKLEHAIKNEFDGIILHAGDLLDGYKVYRGQEFEILHHNLDDMLELAGNILSNLKNDMYVISGNHDYSLHKHYGFDILQHLEEKIDKLHFLGHFTGDTMIDDVYFRLLHPKGYAYSISYIAQKYIRELRKEELQKLDFLILGHHHNFYLLNVQGVNCVGAMTFQHLTDYARRRGYSEDIGFIQLYWDKKGDYFFRKVSL